MFLYDKEWAWKSFEFELSVFFLFLEKPFYFFASFLLDNKLPVSLNTGNADF